MTRPMFAALVVAVLLVAAIPSLHAGDTMRCGTRIVSSGDGKDKVRALCGEPTSVSFAASRARRAITTAPTTTRTSAPELVEVPVEIWTYNFGSSRLLRKLRFVGDELDEIRTDGYGY